MAFGAVQPLSVMENMAERFLTDYGVGYNITT